MFTGQYFDSEIDEYYLRARQYDPHIARFTARDPIFGQFEEPLTLHAYLYCGNDPLNYVDPSGLWMKPHDFDDTQKIINQTTWLVGTHFAIGPLVAFGPVGPYAHGIFDFKDHPWWYGDTFQISSHGIPIGGTQFGNYLAGYTTYYNYGMAGEFSARGVGILYAGGGAFTRWWREEDYSRSYAEEVGSQYWITQGALDANIVRSKSVRFSLGNLLSHDNTFGNLLDRYRLNLWLAIFLTECYDLDFDEYRD